MNETEDLCALGKVDLALAFLQKPFSSSATTNQLYFFSLISTALGTMIFGRRLGCVSSSQDKTNLPDIHEFVHCVQQIFVQSANMTLIPPKMAHYLNLPVWKRFEEAASKALQLASLYVTENARQSDTFDSSKGIIRQLMADGEIALDEISRIIVDLFIAAADTVSNTLSCSICILKVIQTVISFFHSFADVARHAMGTLFAVEAQTRARSAISGN